MDIQGLIANYTSWLNNEISIDKIGDYYEITTPFLKHSNDYIQIYIKQSGNEIIFSDDCAIVHGLKSNGIQLTATRKKQIHALLLQYGVELKEEELVAHAPICSFPQKLQMFLLAMIRIDDIISLSK